MVEKLGGRTENKLKLYIFRLDRAIQQRRETRVKSTKKFQFKHSWLLSRRVVAPHKFRSLIPAATLRQQATLYRWPGAGSTQNPCRGGIDSLPNRTCGLKQHTAHSDDRLIACAQMLLASVDDGTHAFLDRMVLRVDPLDAAVAQRLLRLAIDHPVIGFASSLTEVGGAVLRSPARAPFELVAPSYVDGRLSKTI